MTKVSLSRSVSSDYGDVMLVGELIPGTILLSKINPVTFVSPGVVRSGYVEPRSCCDCLVSW